MYGKFDCPNTENSLKTETTWYRKERMGECSKGTAFAVLDYFHSQGGKFIDPANEYQSEQTDMWLGEWMAARPDMRAQMVIATKYTIGLPSTKVTAKCYIQIRGATDRRA